MESHKRHIAFEAETCWTSSHTRRWLVCILRGIPKKISARRIGWNMRVWQQTVDVRASWTRTNWTRYEIPHFCSHTVSWIYDSTTPTTRNELYVVIFQIFLLKISLLL